MVAGRGLRAPTLDLYSGNVWFDIRPGHPISQQVPRGLDEPQSIPSKSFRINYPSSFPSIRAGASDSTAKHIVIHRNICAR